MAKYRVKIVEKNDGSKVYIPQRKTLFKWNGFFKKIGPRYVNCEFESIVLAEIIIEEYKKQLVEEHNNKTKSIKYKEL